MVSLKHNALSIVSLPRWEFIYSCKYISCRTAKTLRREVFLHGIYLLYMIHLSIQPSITTKKDSWGVFYLDRPPHGFINLWIYIVRGFHPYSLTSHCNWQRLSSCGRCRKDRIEAQISKFILIYLFYTKKWLMHKSD